MHDERRKSERQGRENYFGFGLETGGAYFKVSAFSEQEREYPRAGSRLGDHRRDRGAPNAHIERENEYRVEYNIRHGADKYGKHTRCGESLSRDKRVHAEGQLYENGAHGVHVHIFGRVRNSVFAGAESEQKFFVPYQKHRGEQGRDDKLGYKTVSERLFGGKLVARAHEYRSARRAAVADKRGERRYYHYQRQTYSESRQREVPRYGNVPDIYTVHNIVEHIDKLRHHGRERQPEQQSAYGFRCQKVFAVIHSMPRKIYPYSVLLPPSILQVFRRAPFSSVGIRRLRYNAS